MKKILYLILFLIFSTSCVWASDKIVFVDLNHILSESVTGKKILKDLNDLSKKNEEIFKSTETKLNKKKKKLKNFRILSQSPNIKIK